MKNSQKHTKWTIFAIVSSFFWPASKAEVRKELEEARETSRQTKTLLKKIDQSQSQIDADFQKSEEMLRESGIPSMKS